MNQKTELLTAEEMAERLRVKPDTVKAWARQGTIPKLKLSHKVIRFDPVAVVAALSKHAKEADHAK